MGEHSTGMVWDEYYLWHHAGGGAGVLPQASGLVEPGDFGEEGPHPRRRLRNLIEVTGLTDQLAWIKPRRATAAELGRVHTTDYLNRVKTLSDNGGGDAGGGTPFGPNGFDVASLAAGGCLLAVERVLDGAVQNAYALVKPPGHHAGSDGGNGHCIFNNVAIAAMHARTELGLDRVTVIDWDVHWGNGTQDIFWRDAGVQVISLHQADWYPRGGGLASDVGGEQAVGAHINIPLPPGSGIGAYEDAFTRVVLPAVNAYRPQLILVSCGYDASACDPSGRMLLTSENFRSMMRWTKRAAKELCGGKLVVCHEGGYSPTYVPFCGVAVLEELCGAAEPLIADPFLDRFTGVGYEALQSHQAAAIDEVIEAHGRLGKRAVPAW